MILSEPAKQAAKYLLHAWDTGLTESYFELIDVTAGSVRTHRVLAGLGVLSDEFYPPPISVIFELADYGLVVVVEQISKNSRKWAVRLTPELRTFVQKAFQQRFEMIHSNVFISYKREDRDFTERLSRLLDRVYGSASVWFDKDILGGQVWANTIFNHIASSDCFLYVVSREALESVHCRIEFTEALRLQKSIIPVKLRNHDYPEELTRFQMIAVQHDISAEQVVEIIAAINTRSANVYVVPDNSLWANRTIESMENGCIRVRIVVPANVEPDQKHVELCNTGILLLPSDEITISAHGTITFNNVKDRCDPNGFVNGTSRIYLHEEAYKVINNPSTEIGDKGMVGSFFGWIGNDIRQAIFIGSQFSAVIERKTRGFLYLAVNDAKETYDDNTGEFEVVVEIKRDI